MGFVVSFCSFFCLSFFAEISIFLGNYSTVFLTGVPMEDEGFNQKNKSWGSTLHKRLYLITIEKNYGLKRAQFLTFS